MGRRAVSSRARLAARRLLGWPARRLLDRRIEWILAALDERVGPASDRPSLQHRLDLLETDLRHLTQVLGESLIERRLASLAVADTLALPADTAQFLNWAEGPEGPAARANLWFNPPVPVRYIENAVEVLLVNERIVEQPYVFGALTQVRRPGRILDVGGAESTVALSLASLGHEVHVVDPRGYALEHPGVHPRVLPLDELPRDLQFDAAVALSSIEHFGLSAYGPLRGEPRLDHAALVDIRERLIPSGLLVLTLPCAAVSSQDDFQRIYSLLELKEMLAAWDLVDLSVVWRRDRVTWVRGLPDDPQGRVGVALVTACKPV